MAIFYINISSVGRSAGRTAPGAAAYRAGERLRDERSGKLYNYADRQDVLHKEITLPSSLAAGSAGWARERATLWNTAERAESRANARVAREITLALPHELTAEQRVALTRSFARDIADRFGVAVDAAVHAPRAHGDPRNFHAHFLATTREVSALGLGAKSALELNGTQRYERGLPGHIDELRSFRERAATLINAHLAAAHSSVRVDHRTLAVQGIDREPRARLPWGAYQAEARGLRSEIAERVRAKYRERLRSRDVTREPATVEDVRRQARENWLRLRAQSASAAPAVAEVGAAGKGRDHDFGL